jgi:hypothetical protein
MAIVPSSSSLPSDMIFHVFCKIQSIPQLCKLGLVCKEWYELHRNNILWKPFLCEIRPHSYDTICKNSQQFPSIKMVVQSNIKKGQEAVDLIISLIDEDETLNRVLGDDSMTLQKIKAEPPAQRALIVLRALSKDANPLYTHLVDRVKNECLRFIEVNAGLTTQQRALKLVQEEKCLPLLNRLLRDERGPFNAGQLFCSVAPLMQMFQTPLETYAIIVSSHYKMPEILGSSMDLQFENPMSSVQISSFIDILRPMLKEAHEVTVEDFVECGLINPSTL